MAGYLAKTSGFDALPPEAQVFLMWLLLWKWGDTSN
jgi:hypothetical protein